MFTSRNLLSISLIIFILISLYLGYISTSGEKTQSIRLVDIFIIGPLMIYIGWINLNKNKEKLYNIENLLNGLLIFFGSTTISYNLRNYLGIRKV